MLIKYRFSINGRSVTPIWKDEVQKEYELESQQRFYRAQLSGKIALIKDDFDWANSQSFDTEFVFLIEKSNDLGQTWVDYWTGKFFKTDCKWYQDDKKVELKLTTKDSYNDVLAGLEKEYNLIKLTPGKTEVQIDKRPLIQLYIPGDSVVSCFLSGNSWEQDTAFEVTNESDLINTYYFALASTLHKVFVYEDLDNDISGTPEECAGDYVGESSDTWYGRNLTDVAEETTYKTTFESQKSYELNTTEHFKTSADIGSIWEDENNNYWVLTQIINDFSLRVTSYFHSNTIPFPDLSNLILTHVRGATQTSNISYSNAGTLTTKYLYALRRTSDDVIMFSSNKDYSSLTDSDFTFLADNGTGSFRASKSTIKVYMRYLLDVETISGLNTYELPTDDIVEYNRNYQRAIGYAIDQISITANASTTATEYGLMETDIYFDEPAGFPTYYKYYPVARSTWGLSSIWFNFDFFDWILEEQGRKTYISKDTSSISEAIRVLLNEFAPDIDHDGTSEYSEFLYGETNPITYNTFRLFITQKTNITAGEYDRPAQKAPITLGSIFTMLRDTYQCYWYIEDNKLKIEHISWFKNGGTYSPSPVYAADLTTLINPKNKKAWGFNSSNWEFDKADLAERMQFKWMDDVTFAFEGYPIEVNSKFVEEGKVDDINVGDFTTDIDYMLLNPLAINQDGFALMAAVPGANIFDVDKWDYSQNTMNAGLPIGTPYNDMLQASTSRITSELIEVNGDLEILFADSNHEISVVLFDSNDEFTGRYDLWETTDFTIQDVVKAALIFRKSAGGDITPAEISNVNISLKFLDLTEYALPYIQRNIDGADLRIQNGFMSWIYLHPNYWIYDLPASDVTINDDPYTYVAGIKRGKKQNVKYPSLEDPNPIQLIKTYIGDGQIQKLSINLSSRMNEIQLKYDTE